MTHAWVVKAEKKFCVCCGLTAKEWVDAGRPECVDLNVVEKLSESIDGKEDWVKDMRELALRIISRPKKDNEKATNADILSVATMLLLYREKKAKAEFQDLMKNLEKAYVLLDKAAEPLLSCANDRRKVKNDYLKNLHEASAQAKDLVRQYLRTLKRIPPELSDEKG